MDTNDPMTDNLAANLTIKDWQETINIWATSKGWNTGLEERTFGDWCQLITGEINEAYEDYRNHYQPNEIYYQSPSGGAKYTAEEVNRLRMQTGVYPPGYFKPCGIPIEMADAVIRILHFCEYYQIDLNELIAMKMAYNETRPHRHGGKKV